MTKIENKITEDSKEKKIEGLIELGKFYFVNERYDEAIEKLKKAVKIDKKNAEIYYSLGIVYESKNLFKKADQMYTKALELNPDHELAKKHLEELVSKYFW